MEESPRTWGGPVDQVARRGAGQDDNQQPGATTQQTGSQLCGPIWRASPGRDGQKATQSTAACEKVITKANAGNVVGCASGRLPQRQS